MARLKRKVGQTWIQARRQLRLPTATIWLLILAVCTLLGAVYLAQASQAAEMGRQVEQLKLVKDNLQRQNAQLEADIAAADSPAQLTRRALALGFKEAGPGDLDYVALPDVLLGAKPGTPDTAATHRLGSQPITPLSLQGSNNR